MHVVLFLWGSKYVSLFFVATLGHHLFISVFMLSSKITCDDTYLNKSCIVGQGMFTLQKIKQME